MKNGVKPVSNNRDDFEWEESKSPPLDKLEDAIDDLSGKIDEYIEQEIYKRCAQLFYDITAHVYGSTIFIEIDGAGGPSVRFELKDLLDGALASYDDERDEEDKQADIDDLLPLLRHYVEELEKRQVAINT